MKRIVAIAALLMAGPALAGDLQPKREAQTLPAPRALEPLQSTDDYSWNGIWGYVGIGYGISNTELSVRDKEGSASFDGVGGEGFLGQIQLGLDKQIGDRALVGLFGGAQLTNSETTLEFGGTDVLTIEEGETYFVGARAGYLLNAHNLLYVGGGYFWNVNTEVKGPILGAYSVNDLDTEGWFAEAGLESRVAQNVYLRLSGRYYWGEDQSVRASYDGESFDTGLRVDPDKLEVMGGIVVKFNGLKY